MMDQCKSSYLHLLFCNQGMLLLIHHKQSYIYQPKLLKLVDIYILWNPQGLRFIGKGTFSHRVFNRLDLFQTLFGIWYKSTHMIVVHHYCSNHMVHLYNSIYFSLISCKKGIFLVIHCSQLYIDHPIHLHLVEFNILSCHEDFGWFNMGIIHMLYPLEAFSSHYIHLEYINQC